MREKGRERVRGRGREREKERERETTRYFSGGAHQNIPINTTLSLSLPSHTPRIFIHTLEVIRNKENKAVIQACVRQPKEGEKCGESEERGREEDGYGMLGGRAFCGLDVSKGLREGKRERERES